MPPTGCPNSVTVELLSRDDFRATVHIVPRIVRDEAVPSNVVREFWGSRVFTER